MENFTIHLVMWIQFKNLGKLLTLPKYWINKYEYKGNSFFMNKRLFFFLSDRHLGDICGDPSVPKTPSEDTQTVE